MKSQKVSKVFQALPPYFGGKRKLLSWIFGTLSDVIPQKEWPQLTFIDGFVGGGSVSMFVKAQGFKQLFCNDWSDRSQIILKGLIENQTQTLSREDTLQLIQPITDPGFIQSQFNPSVFSTRHAQALDQVSSGIQSFKNPTKQALGKLLLWHLLRDYVCMSTSIGTSNRPYAEVLDGLRDWQTLNSKRFIDESFPRLLKPVWQDLEKKRNTLNRGIFGGSPVQGSQSNIFELVPQVQGDILYLDPPYPGCLGYESSHRVLDAVLTGIIPEKSPKKSPFTLSPQALMDLLDLSPHIPVWIISYGNNQVSLETLVEMVQKQAPQRRVQGYARNYKHMAHVSKSTSNQELLIVAYL